MNNNPFILQPTHTPQHTQQPPLSSRQLPPRPAQPDDSVLWDVAHPQHSRLQAPPAQWAAPPPPEQSALYTNYDYGLQWQQPQLQYQQDQYYALLPVVQPPPHLCHPAVQPGYNPYQLTAGYHQHYVPHTVGFPQPQPPYYPRLQPQQHLHHTTSPHFMASDRQRMDSPDMDRQVQCHAPPLPQLDSKPPPTLAQKTGVYPGQNQGSDHGYGSRGLDNAQLSVNKEGVVENRRDMSGGGGARGGLMSGNRGGMASRSRSGTYVASNGGDGRGDLSGGGIQAGGNFNGVVTMQVGGRNQFPNISEPATIPKATQFESAQCFSISGHPVMTNVGTNNGIHNVTTVNHYGGPHGLETLKEFVSFAALHDSSAQDPHRRCHPGTRENILSRIRYWIDNPNATNCILWLYGPAGAGKSAIAQTIAHGYHQGEVAATFFFFRSDNARNDGNRLFPTIAWQLAFSIPAAKDLIAHELDKTPHLPTKSVETQFEQLVARLFQSKTNMVSQMPLPAPVVIIDGLDECLDEQLQRRILVIIGNAVNHHRIPLRFLISSRPEVLIEETLNQFQEFTLRIDLATLDDSNRDIEKYLVDHFSVIASKQDLGAKWPGQEIIEEIVFKSSGNFILASTLIRFISDEDYSAVSQLDIVRKLKPNGTMSPFALLDELYLEILQQQRDQDFLKTFLRLLVARSSIEGEHGLHEDDAMLLNIPEQELHIKLRRMRSLLKFKPSIDVYHKSFLDFLQDPSRSGQYHVSRQDGLKRYLKLIVNSVIGHVSIAIEESKAHRTCDSSPQFQSVVRNHPPKIVLPVEDWQEALKPLLDLQDRLLRTSKLQPCRITQVMRELQLHLLMLERISHDVATAPALDAWSPALVTEARQNIPEKDLDRCLSELFSCLQKTSSALIVDMEIIERMSSLLVFDPAEIVARVRSITDAQKLVDIVDSLTNNESFVRQCGRDAARKACLLASETFTRVPVLPQSVFLSGPTQQYDWFCTYDQGSLEHMCSSVLMSRILDHRHMLPAWIIYQGDQLWFVAGNINEKNEYVYEWIERKSPNFVMRIRVMLEVARTIQYFHSMDVVTTLSSFMLSFLALDSNLHAKITFPDAVPRQNREKLIWSSEDSMDDSTYESHILAFARFFDEVCFNRNNGNLPTNHLVEDAKQLIELCLAEDPKSRPTMENVVKEMESWNLT